MTDGNYQDSHRSMFITPLQCRIFKQGSEHFQQITLFIQVLDPDKSEEMDIILSHHWWSREQEIPIQQIHDGGL